MDGIFGNRFFSYRQPAWHALGTVSQEERSAQEAYQIAGPYEVSLEDLFTRDGLKVPQRSIVRGPTTDDPERRVFGVAGPEYVLVTPQEVCEIWDQAVRRPVETLGSLKNGATLFLSTKMPEFEVKGDAVENYLLLVSPMTGMEAIQAITTPVRVVCQNTLRAAQAATTETLRIQHDRNVHKRTALWLDGIYNRIERKTLELKDAFIRFSDARPSQDEVEYILTEAYPMPKEPRTNAPQQQMELRWKWYEEYRRAAELAKTQTRALFEGQGTGMDAESCAGTMFGLYNAVVERADYANLRDKMLVQRARDTLFGVRAGQKERAYVAIDYILNNRTDNPATGKTLSDNPRNVARRAARAARKG